MFIILIIMCIIVFSIINYNFKKTAYYEITHNSYFATTFNIGRNGEYLTYKCLKGYENSGGKFLFNCYLPKDNGETTEIDVILICQDGIYAFESKNYSGWIFGDEKSKTWTQTLPQGQGRSHKEHFLNPIMQNKLHIKWLKNLVGETVPIHSVIVFSERCTLKKVSVESKDIFVINRNRISSIVEEIGNQQTDKLTIEKINLIYQLLYPYTQISETAKLQHIAHIRKTHLQENMNIGKQSQEKQSIEKQSIEKQNQGDREKKDITDICPKCGAKLVLRTAKKGKNAGNTFWGCSNYPSCKYLKNTPETP